MDCGGLRDGLIPEIITMIDSQKAQSSIHSLGGIARAKSLSAKRRKEIAASGGKARKGWRKEKKEDK